jgi:protein-lysine N-methyltransferase EEF2KMT
MDRVWDGSILVSRWIYQNPEFFKNKIVLELGAGCGLCGLVSSRVASKVALSDIGDEVIKTLRENVEINKSQIPKANVSVTSVDFKSNSFVPNPPYLKQQVDVILGSEIMYEVDITEALVKTVSTWRFLCSNP